MDISTLFKVNNYVEFKKVIRGFKGKYPKLTKLIKRIVKRGRKVKNFNLKAELMCAVNDQLRSTHPDKTQSNKTCADSIFWIGIRKQLKNLHINNKILEKERGKCVIIDTQCRYEFLKGFENCKENHVTGIVIKNCLFDECEEMSTKDLIDYCSNFYFPKIKRVDIKNSDPQLILLILYTCIKVKTLITQNVCDVMTIETARELEEARKNLKCIQTFQLD